ncbi:MAG: hypothetical protein JKY96_02910, partial [Phycisphaerales bacterium]|nr:hypothetical protein [Phycisphaerales bacterium]
MYLKECIRILILCLVFCGLASPVLGSPPAGSTPGLRAYWNTNTNGAKKLGQIDWEIYDLLNTIDTIDFANTSQPWTEYLPDSHFGVRIVGQINIPADGIWSFRLGADDGMQLWINGELLVNDPGAHAYRSPTGIKSLTAGKHELEVRYWERTGHAGLNLYWDGPTLSSEEVVPASAFSHPPEEPVYDAGGDGIWAYWFDNARHARNFGQIDWNNANLVNTVQRPSFRKTRGGFRVGGPVDYFGVRFVGIVNIAEKGTWTFELGSDQSAALFIDGIPVISDPSSHGFRWKTGTIDLEKGDHTIEVRYWEGWSDAGLSLAWKGPTDEITQIIPSSAFRPGSGASNPPSGGGLHAYRYNNARHARSVGQVEWANHDTMETIQNIYWPITRGASFTGGPSDYFATRSVGKITIPHTGQWTFGVGSDQSARLYINGVALVDDPSSHGFRWKYGTRTLSAGEHDFEVLHWEGWSDAGLVTTWKGPGDTFEQVIPPSAFSPNKNDPALGVGGDGLRVYWVDNARHARKVGHIDWQSYDRMTLEANIAWPITRSPFVGTTITNADGTSTSQGGVASDYFGVRAAGKISIPTDGNWQFNLGSDQSAQLFIDGQMVINDDSSHGFRWKSAMVNLTAGLHDFEVRYWEGWSDAGLMVS